MGTALKFLLNLKNLAPVGHLAAVSKSGLFCLASAFLFAAPAFAGDFEDGCKLYGSKDYRGAKASFEKVVAAYPRFALGHYYLANTMLSSGQVAKAKSEYQTCLSSSPDPTTAKYCHAVLQKLGGVSGTIASAAGATEMVASAGAATAAAATAEPAESAAEIAAEKRKKEIMDKANEEVRELRATYKHRLDTGDVVNISSNGRVYAPDGSFVFHYAPGVLAIVEAELEEKCNHILYLAELQCKFIK